MGEVHEMSAVGTEGRKLVIKLAQIMDEVKYIQKTGYNKFHKYSYATEADVSEKVREQLARRSVMMIPSVVSREVREHKSRSGNTEYIAIVDMEFRFIDGETGEEIVFRFSGEGQDAGDKAIYKAETGTQKYAMMKVFQIPTGDDPERDSEQPPGNAQQGAQQPQNNGQGQRQQQPQNTPQPPQEPQKPTGPTVGQLKAKYKELFSSDTDFGEVAVVKSFSGNGAGLMNWIDNQLQQREKLEKQIFEACRAKGAEDLKTTIFIMTQLKAGNTYPGILQSVTAPKKG